MQPGFLPRATVEATGLYRYDLPPLLHPDEAQLTGLRAALAQLQREYEDNTTLPLSLHTAVLRHSLTAFLLRHACMNMVHPVGSHFAMEVVNPRERVRVNGLKQAANTTHGDDHGPQR